MLNCVVWNKTEATLSSARGETYRPVHGLSTSSPAPPRAPTPVAAPPVPESKPSIKIKAKGNNAPSGSPQTMTPMAPPPVPLNRKISIAAPSKKRTRDIDDILGDEVDAITREPKSQPTKPTSISFTSKPKHKDEGPSKKARTSKSPEKQSGAISISKKKDRELEAYLNTPSPSPVPQPKPVLKATPTPTAAPAVPAPAAAPAVVMPAQSPFADQDLPSLGGANVPFRPKRAKVLVSTLQKEPSAALVRPHIPSRICDVLKLT